MSTSVNPEKFMSKLLDLMSKAKAVAKADKEAVASFENIEKELQGMKDMDLLPRVRLFDQTLFKQFTALERHLRKIILGAETTYSSKEEINKALVLMKENVDQINKGSVPLVKPMPPYRESIPELQVRWSKVNQSGLDKKMSQEWSQLGLEDRFHANPAMANIRRTYEDLESRELKMCLLSFSIFPDGSVMKKRPLIYWWIGEGFIKSTHEKTAEEVGEDIFKKLMRKGLIDQTDSNASSSPIATNCIMNPWIRRMLISLASEARLFHFDSGWPKMPSYDTSTCRRACLVFDNQIPQGDDSPKVNDLLTVFNVNEKYLGLKKEWLNKLKKVAVLQLGRWQGLATHHIEVEDEGFVNQEDGGFLKGLGTQNKHLKYLSLRGISRITKIPSSILNLVSLEILDLRACHNLETLPSDISSLKKLTHLDISECYLLEGIPKGLEKLSYLQVLKGFLIGSSKSNPCRLGDLAKLKNLRRLSIHMGNEAVVQPGEFNSLKEIKSLRHLKISWGVVFEKLKAKIAFQSLEFSFPPDLEKLDLQGIPLAHVPEWLNPDKLKMLKKLYIRGGELDCLDHGGELDCLDHEGTDKWKVEILRLKYLSKMEIGWPMIKEEFPRLRYLEKIKCHKIEKDKYDEDIVWSEAGDLEISKSMLQSS